MTAKFCPTCHTAIPDHAPGGFCPACLLRDADDHSTLGRLAPSVDEISVAFPQWEIVSLIGEGGMGFVYQVRQPALDRIVALKILSPELSRDPAFAERFAREARVLGKLNHPNIVTVFESGESGGFFYLVMEFVDGVNLRQAMRAGRFTPQQALAVVPGICDALQAAHAQGVWHRDIKPENILLDAQGNVKIVDFGIARLVGDPRRDFTLTRTGAALGSAAYMAPEQHEKPHDVDHRADIYSLGVVIYEMLTGELPLGRFPAPSAKAAVDARIDEIVFRTLEKEREMRQQSATEVKTEMQNAAVVPNTSAPSAIDFSSWKLVLAAVVFSLIGTSWRTITGADGERSTLVGFADCWLNDYSSLEQSYTRLQSSSIYSLISMFLACACWIRWLWLKRKRKQQLVSFAQVSGSNRFLILSCIWISSVAFFLWIGMALTGMYLYCGRLYTDAANLRAPVLKILFASIVFGTLWTLYHGLRTLVGSHSRKSHTIPIPPSIPTETKMQQNSRSGSMRYVKPAFYGGLLLLLPSLILADGTTQGFFLVISLFAMLSSSIILMLDVGGHEGYDEAKAAPLTVRSHRIFWSGMAMLVTGFLLPQGSRIMGYLISPIFCLKFVPSELWDFLSLMGLLCILLGWSGMLRAIWQMHHHYISRKRLKLTLVCLFLPFLMWSPLIQTANAMNRFIMDASDGIMGNEDWSSISGDQVDMREWLLGEWLLDMDASKHGVSNMPITKNLTDALAYIQASESGKMLLTITPELIAWTTKSEKAWKPIQELRMENGSAFLLLKLPDGQSSTMVRFDRHDENALLITPLKGDGTSNGPVPRYTLVFKRKSFGNAEKNQESILESKSVFGPVVERSLYFSDNMRAYLDFQSGESLRSKWELSAIPIEEAQTNWLELTGVDVYAIKSINNTLSQPNAVVVDELPHLSSWNGGCVFAPVIPHQWLDNPQVENMEATLKDAADTQALMGGTYWFKTSDGAKGIVHVYGINQSSQELQLRYRLFQQQP